MSKKDYELIARAIRERTGHDPYCIAHSIADALEANNPRFDRAKFIKACGIKE